MFTQEDLAQISGHGLTVDKVESQISNFKSGFPFLSITRAASVGDGIVKLTVDDVDRLSTLYASKRDELSVVKFVPASGAATRMFKELFEFVEQDKRGAGIDKLLSNIDKFAFYPELKSLLAQGASDKDIVSAIIKSGLEYGSKPKGMVTFHNYGSQQRKAAQEHLVEGAQYAANRGVVRIHFTISAEHKSLFEALFSESLPIYEKQYGVKYDISYSTQMSSTDTIAVNPDNTPFRDDKGALLFRPAGHGALIENLDKIDSDIIFIKTVDNVTTDARRGDTIKYKESLAGLLLELQGKAFQYIKELNAGAGDLAKIASFVEGSLQVKLPASYDKALLLSILNRPLRVCGMVLNEGEPGGGPFWVSSQGGVESLQIAESSQISPDDISIMKNATHFNPVDLVCAVKDVNGAKFDLSKYVDPSTGFISEKSSAGRDLKAQELPGLWNGAMAQWNTIFVEVPITTFSPVKVVQDLLRPEHQ
ncbi:MAG: DUF4301 family protein [Rikenellaceae bacterium]